jgi:hypothetical protein
MQQQQEQQFRLSMTSNFNQINEVIPEEKESNNSFTGRNTPLEESKNKEEHLNKSGNKIIDVLEYEIDDE